MRAGLVLAALLLASPAAAELRSPYLQQDPVLFDGGGHELYIMALPWAEAKPPEANYAALAAEAVCHVLGHSPGALTFPVRVHFLDVVPTPMGRVVPLGEPAATETVTACGAPL